MADDANQRIPQPGGRRDDHHLAGIFSLPVLQAIIHVFIILIFRSHEPSTCELGEAKPPLDNHSPVCQIFGMEVSLYWKQSAYRGFSQPGLQVNLHRRYGIKLMFTRHKARAQFICPVKSDQDQRSGLLPIQIQVQLHVHQ